MKKSNDCLYVNLKLKKLHDHGILCEPVLKNLLLHLEIFFFQYHYHVSCLNGPHGVNLMPQEPDLDSEWCWDQLLMVEKNAKTLSNLAKVFLPNVKTLQEIVTYIIITPERFIYVMVTKIATFMYLLCLNWIL